MAVTWKKLAYDEDIWTTTAKARAYRSGTQANLTDGVVTVVELNVESYDPGSNFDIGVLASGTADGTTANHLIDSGYDFAAEGVVVGHRIKNTTDTTYTYVTAVAVGDLTVRDDIFVDTDGWEVLAARFTAPVSGYYSIFATARFIGVVADKLYLTHVYVNGARIALIHQHASFADSLGVFFGDTYYFAANDYVDLRAQQKSGGDAADVSGSGGYSTFLSIHFLSKA